MSQALHYPYPYLAHKWVISPKMHFLTLDTSNGEHSATWRRVRLLWHPAKIKLLSGIGSSRLPPQIRKALFYQSGWICLHEFQGGIPCPGLAHPHVAEHDFSHNPRSPPLCMKHMGFNYFVCAGFEFSYQQLHHFPRYLFPQTPQAVPKLRGKKRDDI